MVEQVSLSRAKELKLMKYHGRPCKHCKGVERWVSTRQCTACQAIYTRKWQHEHRDERNRRRNLRRAANRQARAKDKVNYAHRCGKLIVKPFRGTAVLQANLRPDQCKAIIRQPVPPVYGVTQRKREELEAFKKTLPMNSVCCGSPVLLGFQWCKFHYVAALDAEALLEKAERRSDTMASMAE
jgi:hypothetical protein